MFNHENGFLELIFLRNFRSFLQFILDVEKLNI